MWKILLSLAVPLALSACVHDVPDSPGQCPVVSTGGWRAWIDLMPGAETTLNVSGKVSTPTGGYRIRLEPGPVLRSEPQVQQVYLHAEPPAGGATQAVVTHDVSTSIPASGRYGAVTILCQGETLAEIRPVEEAH